MDTQKTPISDSRRWYDKKRFVLPALFLFAPLGIALLWMGESFQKNVKIGLTIFFSLVFVGVILSPKEPSKTVVVNEEKQEVVTSNEGGTVQFDANGKKVEVVEEEVNSQDNKTNDEVNVEEMTDLERARLIQENPKTQWAMKLVQGEKWDFNKITKKLGNNYEVIQPTQLNPNIVKAYYFPDANVTLFHNSMKGTFYFLRIGKASE